MDDTLLHYATYLEKEKVIIYLIKAGADPNAKNKVGILNNFKLNKSPLEIANTREAKILNLIRSS
jgi:ankyrin repeat protein